MATQILSRLAFFDFLAIHHPSEYLLIGNHFNRTDIRLGQRENLEDYTGLDEDKILALENPTAGGILSTAKTLAYQKQSDDLLSFLADFPSTQQHAAWMLSSIYTFTNFIHSIIGGGSEGYFPSDEFRCVTRAKLGLGPTNDPPPPASSTSVPARSPSMLQKTPYTPSAVRSIKANAISGTIQYETGSISSSSNSI